MQKIIRNIFKPSFLDELFKAKELLSKKAIYLLFHQLIKASSVKLDEESMQKVWKNIFLLVHHRRKIITIFHKNDNLKAFFIMVLEEKDFRSSFQLII